MGKKAVASLITGTALVAVALVAAPVSAQASAASWNTVFTPPSSANHNAIPPVDAPSTPWKPGAGRTKSPTAAGASAKVASPNAVSSATVGAPGLGSLPYYSFDTTDLSLEATAQVNLGNGNLLLTANDGILNGAGEALRSDRFYNGLSTSNGAFGGGFSSSLSQTDVGLTIGLTSATFKGSNGYSETFTKSGGSYTAPSNFAATLTANSGSTTAAYTLQYNSTGEKLNFSSSGYVTSDTDRNGVGSTYSYDGSGRVSTVSTASGRQYTIGWSGNTPSTITHIDDSAGRDVQYDTDSSGRLTKVTKPDGDFEEYTYDSDGRVATAEFPSANTSGDIVFTFGYDSSNRVTSIKSAQTSAPSTTLSSTTYAYASGTTTVTDGNGHAGTYTIDSSGRVTAAKNALNESRSQTWTSSSDVATTTDALANGSTPGNTTKYSYDQLNNATGVTYPTGAAASATYAQGTACPSAGSGNPYEAKCSSDDAGNKSQYTYDSNGNLTGTKTTDSSGNGAVSQSYTYETAGGSICGGFAGQVCSATDGDGHTTNYTYDSSGDLAKVAPPSPLGSTTYSYDSLGRVLSVTDGNGKTTNFTYNAKDLVEQSTFAGGATYNLEYYENGLVEDGTDSAAGKQTNTYDGLGRLLTVTGPGSGTTQTYAYDNVGNITSYTDANGKVAYGYDAANELTSIVEPGGSCTSGTTAPAASSGCVKYAYDANGDQTMETLPGGAKVATTHDLSGRAVQITGTATGTTTPSVSIGYSYGGSSTASSASDRTSIQSRTSTMEQGVAAGAVTKYTYDDLGRMTKAAETSGTTNTATWSYGYDNAGNRTSQTTSGSTVTAASMTYTYNSANELTGTNGDSSTWTYDAAGNETQSGQTAQTYTLDTGRDSVSAIGATTYSVFGQGNTNTLTRSASSTTYTTAALGLMSEATSSGTTAYTRGPKGNIVSARNGSTRLYYVLDSDGSVVGVFGATGTYTGGYSYTPYGTLRSATNNATITANSIRYDGGYWDSSANLYRFGSRYYDPTTGRFTQYDPSGQESNPYSFASGDPINGKDPSGDLFTNFSIEACLGVCLSVGADVSEDGSVRPTVGVGVGPDAGVTGEATVSSGEAESGGSVGAECTAGGVAGGVDTDGSDVSGDVGVTTATDIGCEAKATDTL